MVIDVVYIVSCVLQFSCRRAVLISRELLPPDNTLDKAILILPIGIVGCPLVAGRLEAAAAGLMASVCY